MKNQIIDAIPTEEFVNQLSPIVHLTEDIDNIISDYDQVSIPSRLNKKQACELKEFYNINSLAMSVKQITTDLVSQTEGCYLKHIYEKADAIKPTFRSDVHIPSMIELERTRFNKGDLPCILIASSMEDTFMRLPEFTATNDFKVGLLLCMGTYAGIPIFTDAMRARGDKMIIMFNQKGLNLHYKQDSLKLIANDDEENVDITGSFDLKITDNENAKYFKIV